FRLRERLAVEVVLEDRQHRSIAASAGVERAPTRGVEAGVAVLLCEAEEAQTRSVAPLGVPSLAQDHLAESARVWTDLLGPAEDARGRPLRVRAMAARHVVGNRREPATHEAANVNSDALADVKYLHHGRRCAEPELDVVGAKRVRRRVEVILERNVVVDIEADLLPETGLERHCGQRHQRGLVEPLEELAPARLVRAHGARVEVRDELSEAGVERAERRERLVADPRKEPALGDLNADLHLRLVAR